MSAKWSRYQEFAHLALTINSNSDPQTTATERAQGLQTNVHVPCFFYENREIWASIFIVGGVFIVLGAANTDEEDRVVAGCRVLFRIDGRKQGQSPCGHFRYLFK